MWTRRGLVATAVALLVGLTPASVALASAPAGAVQGIVTAEAGGLQLPRVSVTLRSESTGSLVRVGATDLDGAFQFDHVPAGRYSLEASHPNFQRVTVRPVLVVDGVVRREHVALPDKTRAPVNNT